MVPSLIWVVWTYPLHVCTAKFWEWLAAACWLTQVGAIDYNGPDSESMRLKFIKTAPLTVFLQIFRQHFLCYRLFGACRSDEIHCATISCVRTVKNCFICCSPLISSSPHLQRDVGCIYKENTVCRDRLAFFIWDHDCTKPNTLLRNCPAGNRSRSVCSRFITALVASSPLLVEG